MMMVVTTCPDCGQVHIPIVNVLLQIRDYSDCNRYSFTCPRCEAWISRPAGPAEVAVLRGHCCPERLERVPREILERRSGPPLTVDDLIDFGLNLSQTDFIAAGLTGR